MPLIVGLIGGTAEWVFAFPDRISVTVSAADRLVDATREALAQTLWRDVAAVHDLPDATAALADRQGEARHLRRHAGAGAPTPAAATPLVQLFLAGDWTETGLPATIEGALRSGERGRRAACGPSPL